MTSKILKSEGSEHDSSKRPASIDIKAFSHLIEHSEQELTLSKCSQSTFKTLVSRHQISVDYGDKLDLSPRGNYSELNKLFVGKK
jgi:hypothetical protein